MSAPVRADLLEDIDAANRAYARGQYSEALDGYRSAQVEIPEAPELRYNIGGALYADSAFQEAVAAFDSALAITSDDSNRARILHNKGNALFRQDDFGGAAEAYKQSLRHDPTQDDTKYNLELALSKLQEQEQQQQQQSDENQDQENQQDQSEQEQEQQQEPQQQQDENQQEQQPNTDQNEQNQDQQQQQQSGKMSPEDARRILEAIRDNERDVQKQARLRMMKQQTKTYVGNPW